MRPEKACCKESEIRWAHKASRFSSIYIPIIREMMGGKLIYQAVATSFNLEHKPKYKCSTYGSDQLIRAWTQPLQKQNNASDQKL